MTTHPSATKVAPTRSMPESVALWQEDFVHQAWLYSKAVTKAGGAIEQVAIAINKGQALSTREHEQLNDAKLDFKQALAGLVLSLYPVTAARAQDVARTLPHAPRPSVGIEDISANLDKVMRELFTEAGIAGDFKP